MLIIFSFFVYKVFSYLFKNIEDEKLFNFLSYLKDIELKNEQLENSNLTTKIVKNRIEQINSTIQQNITFNESNITNILQEKYIFDNVETYIDNFIELPLSEYNISNFTICKNPKISIIVPVYNSQNEILYLHKTIQEQSLKDLEIIYIDDFSNDNSSQLIESLQKKDRRIILLKNKKNKGPFYCRNKGAIFANGEYIQFLDSDDILVGNILEKVYITAKTKNIDIVQYEFVIKYEKYKYFKEKIKDDIIYQPELSDLLFYGKGKLEQAIFYIFNRIIKKDVYLNALMFMGDEILNEKLYYNEDMIQLFCIFRNASSFLFFDDIGYAKLPRKNNVTSLYGQYHNQSYANRIFHDNFIEVKFLYKKTENNEHDKAICFEFLKICVNQYHPILNNITEGYELFDEVFDLLLDSKYFNDYQKINMQQLKDKMMINRYTKK